MSASRTFRSGFGAVLLASAFVAACSGWDPSRPFEREAPEVREAIGHIDAGDAATAGGILEEYLATGQCKEGNIGTPTRVRERANGSFDLGLALFKLGERYGHRFGDEENDAGLLDPALKTQRTEQVDCALRVVRAIGGDASQPVDLRARARYLEGNLDFLDARYEDAVKAYDLALELAPGMGDAGPIAAGDSGRTYSPDLVGRDAAYNRAIALRRIEDKKDAGQDGGQDASPDSGGDGGGGDGGPQDDKDGGDKSDAGKDSGGSDKPQDAGADSGADDDQKKEPPKPSPDDQKKDAGAPPPPSRQNQDERMLDQLENAPTVQQESAKKQAQKRRVRGMNDK